MGATKEEKYELLGFNISRMRKKAKISQKKVAKAFNVTTRTISNWEHGKGVDVILLIDLADMFDCTIDDFYLGLSLSK